MDTGYNDEDATKRFARLRRSLRETTQHAIETIQAARNIQESETMRLIMAQHRLTQTREALEKSTTLIDDRSAL